MPLQIWIYTDWWKFTLETWVMVDLFLHYKRFWSSIYRRRHCIGKKSRVYFLDFFSLNRFRTFNRVPPGLRPVAGSGPGPRGTSTHRRIGRRPATPFRGSASGASSRPSKERKTLCLVIVKSFGDGPGGRQFGQHSQKAFCDFLVNVLANNYKIN